MRTKTNSLCLHLAIFLARKQHRRGRKSSCPSLSVTVNIFRNNLRTEQYVLGIQPRCPKSRSRCDDSPHGNEMRIQTRIYIAGHRGSFVKALRRYKARIRGFDTRVRYARYGWGWIQQCPWAYKKKNRWFKL